MGRLEASFEMCDEMRAGLEAGIRARHPQYGDSEIRTELLRLLYGERLAEAVRSSLSRP